MIACMDARELADTLGLQRHPEGGFFRETFRSELSVTPPGWPGPRSFATSILYLLAPGECSVWHRVRGEELWLWQGGGPMRLRVDDDEHVVGPEPAAGHELQVLVPGRAWQSAAPDRDEWSLVACVVAPGFDFTDFEFRDAER
jgi:predicted cupin superfamily sugar epimerase